MSDHDWIRYERGELAGDEALAVERSLEASADGRVRLELLRFLRATASAPGSFERLGDGAQCPSEHALALLAEGQLDADIANPMRAHLVACGHCLLLLEAALEELAAGAAEAEQRAGERRAGFRLLANPLVRMAAAAAVLAVFALLVFERPSWEGGQLAALARIDALPVRTPRDAPADETERHYREGLANYAAADWVAAVDEFALALEGDPERVDIALYLGSAQLHLERAADALAVLREGLRHADEAWRPEVVWQLAQAALLTNDGHWARELLRELEPSGVDRSGAARELLVELGRLER